MKAKKKVIKKRKTPLEKLLDRLDYQIYSLKRMETKLSEMVTSLWMTESSIKYHISHVLIHVEELSHRVKNLELLRDLGNNDTHDQINPTTDGEGQNVG